MELAYAPASAQDADTIYDLSRDLIDRYEDVQNIDYDRVLRWVRRKIEDHIAEYICVFADGRKAGFYRFRSGAGMMELDDLYILPEFRNRGIGTKVIEKCCHETDAPVMLYVFTENTGALSLYQRLGFRVARAVGTSRCIMVRDPEVKHENYKTNLF